MAVIPSCSSVKRTLCRANKPLSVAETETAALVTGGITTKESLTSIDCLTRKSVSESPREFDRVSSSVV